MRTRRCGATHGTCFSVGERAGWSYLLPGAPAAAAATCSTCGRVDRAGNVTKRLVRGRTRVVFVVR